MAEERFGRSKKLQENKDALLSTSDTVLKRRYNNKTCEQTLIINDQPKYNDINQLKFNNPIYWFTNKSSHNMEEKELNNFKQIGAYVWGWHL